MATLEKDVEQMLVRMVKIHRGLCLKWVCPGWAGVPDRIILLPGGRAFFVELKRPKGGKPSKMQQWWSHKLKELGFVHLWIKSFEDVKDLDAIIRVWMWEVGRG